MNQDDVRTHAYFLWLRSYSQWLSSTPEMQIAYPMPDANYFWYEAEYLIRHGGE